MNPKLLSGENLKYAVAFSLFLGAASLFVSVVGLSVNSGGFNSSSNTAAVANAITANATVPADVSVTSTSGGSTLKLKYDTSRKEDSLNATFAISINGGRNGIYVYQYPSITFHDSKGGVYYVNSQRNNLSPILNAQKKVNSYGEVVYFVPASQPAVFLATATVDPKSLFAGTYYASLDNLIGFSSLVNNPSGFTIGAGFKTNSVTIVGEVTPYVSNVSPDQGYVGDKIVLTGQRLNGSMPYFDGTVSTSSFVSATSDGTSMTIKIPNLSADWHIVTVSSTKGISNGLGLYVLAHIATTTGCYTFTTNLTVGSTGQDVVALQSFLSVNGYLSSTYVNGYFGSETKAALASYQTSVGIPADGFFGPLTEAKLNASCSGGVVAVVCPAGYICTPPNNTTVCPAGYTCTVVTTNCPSGFTCYNQILTTTSQPPVISGGTFPTTLTVGQQGTWTVNASDPQNGSLSYSVNWGDVTTCPIGFTCVTPAVAKNVSQQTSTFTHSYSTAGTYTVTFTVSNTAGLSAVTTATVQVGGPTVTLPVTVSNTSVIYSPIIATPNSTTTGQQFTLGFSITAGNSPVFIWKDASHAVGSTYSSKMGMSIQVAAFSDSDSTNDGATYFYIAPGQTKSFTVVYTAKGAPTDVASFQVNSINYGLSSSAPTGSTATGSLQNLKATLFH